MAQSFNYERAWSELAGPYFDNVVTEAAKSLLDKVGRLGREWRQDQATLDVPIPDYLQEYFEEIPPIDLAVASRTIYFWGHWASRGRGPAKDSHGANWKFSSMADQVLRKACGLPRVSSGETGYSLSVHEGQVRVQYGSSRQWTWEEVCWAVPEYVELLKSRIDEGRLHYDSFDEVRAIMSKSMPHADWFYGPETFLDHEEGTKWDMDELPKKYQPLVADEFEILAVKPVNHKPHPFMIGTQHFPKDGGMYIQPEQAPCAMRGCGRSYKEHTSDTVMFLQCKKTLENSVAHAALLRLKEAFEKDGTHIDGFGFVESPEKHSILPPVGSEDSPKEESDGNSPSQS